MLCYIDTQTDPFFNLAAEEYLLASANEPVFRLWRNDSCIVIGKYQNALAEINYDYVRRNGIKVVRRLSGGGAVFHDLGNLNFTFIDKKSPVEEISTIFKKFTKPVLGALQNLGIDARLDGRNDLTIGGSKFSGNAVCIHKDHLLQHGTLLFSTSMTDLSQALNSRPEKFTGKSVKSIGRRVTNISEHLSKENKMDIEQFISYLKNYIENKFGSEFKSCRYTEKDLEAINKLRETKYCTDEWNFGSSPQYTFHNTFKLSCGFFEIFLEVKKGIILKCKILGDYFFFRPTEKICNALEGTKHTYASIIDSLSRFDIKEYFGEDIREQLAAKMIETN